MEGLNQAGVATDRREERREEEKEGKNGIEEERREDGKEKGLRLLLKVSFLNF